MYQVCLFFFVFLTEMTNIWFFPCIWKSIAHNAIPENHRRRVTYLGRLLWNKNFCREFQTHNTYCIGVLLQWNYSALVSYKGLSNVEWRFSSNSRGFLEQKWSYQNVIKSLDCKTLKLMCTIQRDLWSLET